MNTENEIEEKIDELGSRAGGSSKNREEIEFSELRDLLSAVKTQGSERLMRDLEHHVLEDVWSKQIEGATTSDYISLIREFGDVGVFGAELIPITARHVLVSEKDIDTEELLDAVEKNPEDGTVRTVMERVYRKDPGAFTGHADRLFESDDEAIRDALVYVAIGYPEEMKRATPKFFESFERGDNRQVFCNFLAELCRVDPDYAEEWVEKTLTELTDEDFETDPEHDDIDPIEDCVRTMAKWCPFEPTELGLSSPRVARIVSSEGNLWGKAARRERGRRLSVEFYLGPREFQDIRKAAERNGDTFREAVEKGLKEYAGENQP
jgi:hypothetical protein